MVDLRTLLQHSVGVRSAGGSEERHRCPLCVDRGKTPDRKGHLFIHTCGGKCAKCRSDGKNRTGYWRCWRCGASGRLGVSSYDERSIAGWRDELHLSAFREALDASAELPVPEVAPLVPGMSAHSYLIGDRGMSQDEITRYGFCLGLGRLSGRVVLPDLDDLGHWLYWVARAVSDLDPIRYVSPPSHETVGYSRVWRLEHLGPIAAVTEGIFSAVAFSRVFGKETGATYGKDVDAAQVWHLRGVGVKDVYCALDGNALMENLALAEMCERAQMRAYIVRFPGKSDPAELSASALSNCIDRAVRYSERAALELRVAALKGGV